MERPWPDAIDGLLGSLDAPVVRRAPHRWTVGSLTIRRVVGDGPTDRLDERSDRLAAAVPFPVPEVRGRFGGWVVMAAPPGERADRPERHAEPGTLAAAVGAGLAALHALSPIVLDWSDGRVTGADGWASIVERCRFRVSAGLVEVDRLPPPYDRYRPERLLEMLEQAGEVRRAREPGEGGGPDLADAVVVCHGSPTLDRVVVDGGRFVGFDGLETTLVADRHLDLAVAHRSVADLLGAEAVIGLYEGYGADPDLARLDRAVLASHLLGIETVAPAIEGR